MFDLMNKTFTTALLYYCCLAVLARFGKIRNFHLLKINNNKETGGEFSWVSPFWF